MRKALASLPWVKNVQVNFDRKQATITAETGKVDEAAIQSALEKAGFEGKLAR